MGLVAGLLAVALGVGGALTAFDLAQVAVRYPQALSAGDAGRLFVAYAIGALALASTLFALRALVRRLVRPAAARAGGAAGIGIPTLAIGAWFIGQELALQLLPGDSRWRPWVVVGLAVAALAAVRPMLAAWRRFSARPVWAGGLALFATLATVGAVGSHLRPEGTPASPPAGAPNVVLVTIDATRADHLSCYGYERPTSPSLDALASEGVLFEWVFSQAPYTKPSVASLLTGRLPSDHRATRESSMVEPESTILPEILRRHGYATAAFTTNAWLTPEFGFGQGVDHFHTIMRERIIRFPLAFMALRRANRLVDRGAYVYSVLKRRLVGKVPTATRDARLSEAVLAWLDAPPERPFFLYVHFMSPHHPYDAPPPLGDMFVRPGERRRIFSYPRKSGKLAGTGEALPAEEYEELVARYDGGIRFADEMLGRLVAKLRERRLLDETVLVVTADHGEEFYDHRNWGHGHSLYNELLHVPLVVRYPPVTPAGRRVRDRAMVVDVLPTLLDLAGVPAPPALAGRSLVPAIRGQPIDAARELRAEHLHEVEEARMVIREGKKLISMRAGSRRWQELYDLDRDVSERQDLFESTTSSTTPARLLD